MINKYNVKGVINLKKKEKRSISKKLSDKFKIKQKITVTKERVSEFLELPREVLLKSTKITCIENNSILIEGYQKIIDYYDNYIKLKSNNMDIVIDGENLDIVEITDYELVIEGKIYSLNYQK